MANRLGFTIVLSVFGVSCALAACGDDTTDSMGENGGAGGDSTVTGGTKTGGSTSGGSAGKSGGTGGKSASAGAAGETTSGGAGGDTSEPGLGGAGGAAAGMGGAAGAAGSDGAGGAAPLEYVCGTTTISHKLCSALLEAGCADTSGCPECVPLRTNERATFETCPSCLAEFDRFYQCGIDAYASGNISSGIECYEGDTPDQSIADLNDACAEYFWSAIACSDVEFTDECPATWPVE